MAVELLDISLRYYFQECFHDFWTQVGIAFILHHLTRSHFCAYDGQVERYDADVDLTPVDGL